MIFAQEYLQTFYDEIKNWKLLHFGNFVHSKLYDSVSDKKWDNPYEKIRPIL